MNDLARRAVACKGWRWMEGVAAGNGYRVLAAGVDVNGPWFKICEVDGHSFDGSTESVLPNFDDALTVQAVLLMVREAWGDPGIGVMRGPGGEWYVETYSYNRPRIVAYGHPSEAAALVAALEAAP